MHVVVVVARPRRYPIHLETLQLHMQVISVRLFLDPKPIDGEGDICSDIELALAQRVLHLRSGGRWRK